MTVEYLVKDLEAFVPDLERDLVALGVLNEHELAVLLVALRELLAGVRQCYRDVEGALAHQVGERRRFVVDGVGEVEVRVAVRRSGWQHDELLRAVLARITDEPGVWCDVETGEKHPPQEIGRRIAQRLRDCVSFGAGKVTGLRALGLEPDEFCTVDGRAFSVVLPRVS